MPVLITATTVTLILTGGSPGGERASFLDPASVRAKLSELPQSNTRDRALAIADHLMLLGEEYSTIAATTLEVYEAHAARWGCPADTLIADMEILDAAFERLMREMIHDRQRLLELLSPEAWLAVFV